MQIFHHSQLWRRMFAVFILLFTVVLALMPQSEHLFSGLTSNTITYEPGRVTAVETENLSPSPLKGGQMLGDQSLKHRHWTMAEWCA